MSFFFSAFMEIDINNTLVLEYLKKHGQMLDREMAKATGISLTQIRNSISALELTKAISSCSVTNFEDGVAIEGMLCRISGYIPPAAPGRKATPQPN
jgi:transcription initiation factor IIE alpha subunit